MFIKQISIFLENKKGRLAEVTKVISQEMINISALSLADTNDFGILRIIVDDPDKCVTILKEHNFIAQETDVIAIEVEDKPSGLNQILQLLEKHEINIEYMYATVERFKDNAIVIFKVHDPKKIVELLKKVKIPLISSYEMKKKGK